MSGLMGGSARALGGPRQCFNGQKYSYTGWLDATTSTINLSQGAFKGRITAFVDRNSMNDPSLGDSTILKIPFPGSNDVFLLYNRKKSFNDGTRLADNLITVTQAMNGYQSKRLAALNAAQSHVIPGTTINIEVCSMRSSGTGDRATLSIFDTSLGQSSLCSARFKLTTLR
jgi:hypothetical protein